nr:AgmX/PglI C-terminal domain-containing protein [Kofleriaceae bacterium]
MIKIGKVPSAHLRIDDESVSRMHAILEVDPKGTVHVIDLGSTRGTYVNGQKINKAEVQSGDVIKVGDISIEMTMQAATATEAEATAMTVTMPTPVPMPMPVPPQATTKTTPAAMLTSTSTPMVIAPIAVAVPQPPRMPLPAMPMRAAMPAMPAVAIDNSEIEDASAQAIEVAAMFGDSVVAMKHCSDPKSGHVKPLTWGLLGMGAIGLATAATAFIATAAMQSRNAANYDTWTKVQHKPAWAFRPEMAGSLTDGLTTGGLALGLLGAALGFARVRRERRSPFFRIGSAPGVEHATDHVPMASFPLVAPSGDDFVLNLAPGMDGELTVDGTSTPLVALAAQGRARPSYLVPGAIEVPIPARSRIRAHAGATTFVVSAVARPKEHAMPLLALDGRTAAYIAGSLAVHLALWGAMQFGFPPSSGVGLEMTATEDTALRAHSEANEDPVIPPPPPENGDATDAGGASGRTAMAEGKSGNRESQVTQEHTRQIENRNAPPQLSREAAREIAAHAGIFGSERLDDAIANISGGDADFSSGFDKTTMWGGLYGPSGESFGTGVGRFGVGPGGGCTVACGGIGSGRYNTIGDSGMHGKYGPGNGYGEGLPKRNPGVPTVTISRPIATGGLDREIIHRYVRRAQQRISYCYEKQLLATPGLEGDVTVQFLILPNGTVGSSSGAGMNSDVAQCVAGVVGAIAFPAPSDGGSVQVKYPFHFHASGK